MKTYIQILSIALLSLSTYTDVAAQLYRNVAPVETRRYGSFINEHINRGDRHMQRGEFEQALIAYDLAVMQSPGFAESYIKRAIAKMRLGDLRSAEEDQRMAVRLNPYVMDLYGYGDPMRKTAVMAFDDSLSTRLQEDGNIYLTINDITQDIQSSAGRRNAALFKYRGNLMVLLGRYLDAIDDYDEAILLDSEYAEAYYNRGIARILAGNRADACYDFMLSTQFGFERGDTKIEHFCAF